MQEIKKTKKQLVAEIAALRAQIYEFETIEKQVSIIQSLQDFNERRSRYFPYVQYMNESIFYVIFDRQFEFVSQKFAELSRRNAEGSLRPRIRSDDIGAWKAEDSRDRLREGFHGGFSAQEYEYTGMKKDGSRIECETFVLFIPYKWGMATHGMLHDISLRKRIDEELQRRGSDPSGCLEFHTDECFPYGEEHRFIRVNTEFCKSIGLPMGQIVGKTMAELFPNMPAKIFLLLLRSMIMS